jgi:tetratricopeptide (TPR) repeat protein
MGAADPALPDVQRALAVARTTADAAKVETDRLEAVLADLSRTTAAAARGDATTEHVKALKATLDEAPAKLQAVAVNVDAAAKAAANAAGANPSPEAAKVVAEAQALAQRTRDAIATARDRSMDAAKKANDFVTDWTGDVQLDIDMANAKMDVGNFVEARRLLDRAARQLRKANTKNQGLDFAYAQLFDKMAVDTEAPDAKRQLLQRAAEAYRRVVKTGGGRFAHDANDRLAKLPEEINQLAPQ